MTEKIKAELFVEDQNGNQKVAYPFVESKHVLLSNGIDVESAIAQDVSLIEVEHDKNYINTGSGNKDISSSIVDSSVVSMNIHGNTYHNIVGEPYTNLMTIEEDVIDINKINDKIETRMGKVQEMYLQGQSLCNIATTHGFGGADNEVYEYIFKTKPIKFGETFTIFIVKPRITTIHVGLFDQNRDWVRSDIVTVPENKKIVYTVTDEGLMCDRVGVQLETHGDNTGYTQGLVILEGDRSDLNITEYFYGITETSMPSYLSTNKNLFKKPNDIYEQNGCYDHSGIYQDSRVDCISDFVMVKPNTKYAYRVIPSAHITQSMIEEWGGFGDFAFFDEQQNFISRPYSHHTSDTCVTTPSNCKYLKVWNNLYETSTDGIYSYKEGLLLEVDDDSDVTPSQICTIDNYVPHLETELRPMGDNLIISKEMGVWYETNYGGQKPDPDFITYVADVEYRTRVYVKNCYSDFTFWTSNNNFISGCKFVDELTDEDVSYGRDGHRNKNGYIRVPNNAKYLKVACLNSNNAKTPYISDEITLRSLPNGVKDTLDLKNGYYIKRVGEVVLDGIGKYGSYQHGINEIDSTKYQSFYMIEVTNNVKNVDINDGIPIVCDRFKAKPIDRDTSIYNRFTENAIQQYCDDTAQFAGTIEKSILGDKNIGDWFAENPTTIHYQLAQPLFISLNKQTYGNINSVTFYGLEKEGWGILDNLGNGYYRIGKNITEFENIYKDNNNFAFAFTDDFKWHAHFTDLSEGFYIDSNFVIRIHENRLKQPNRDGFLEYLKEHPLTIYYRTSEYTDTNIYELLSFEEGSITYNANQGNYRGKDLCPKSLTPKLTCRIPTKNSYPLDLMKQNQLYTILFDSINTVKNFNFDGQVKQLSTNSTFVSPNEELVNKMLITNNDVKNLVIIEGDMTSKNIENTYGIKSLFDDKESINIITTNKNLFCIGDVVTVDENKFDMELTDNSVISRAIVGITGEVFGAKIKIKVKPSTFYTFSCEAYKNGSINYEEIKTRIYDNSGIYGFLLEELNGNSVTFSTNSNTEYITIGLNCISSTNIGDTFELRNIQLTEGYASNNYEKNKTIKTFIPIKSNNILVKNKVHVIDSAIIKYHDVFLEPNTTYLFSSEFLFDKSGVDFNSTVEIAVTWNDGDLIDRLIDISIWERQAKNIIFTTPSTMVGGYYGLRIWGGKIENNYRNIIRTTSLHKLTTTGLHKLPNGVEDELLINNENGKAKLVQRIGVKQFKRKYDNEWNSYTSSTNQNTNVISFFTELPNAKLATENTIAICDKFIYANNCQDTKDKGYFSISDTEHKIYFNMDKNIFVNELEFNGYLLNNSITVYYELEEPIIKDITMAGYPYSFKDGKIYIDSDMNLNVDIKYSINQQHLIESNNSDLIRHEQDINYLYELIKQYIKVDYESTLLSLK